MKRNKPSKPPIAMPSERYSIPGWWVMVPGEDQHHRVLAKTGQQTVCGLKMRRPAVSHKKNVHPDKRCKECWE